jgi:hypothetical protein
VTVSDKAPRTTTPLHCHSRFYAHALAIIIPLFSVPQASVFPYFTVRALYSYLEKHHAFALPQRLLFLHLPLSPFLFLPQAQVPFCAPCVRTFRCTTPLHCHNDFSICTFPCARFCLCLRLRFHFVRLVSVLLDAPRLALPQRLLSLHLPLCPFLFVPQADVSPCPSCVCV